MILQRIIRNVIQGVWLSRSQSVCVHLKSRLSMENQYWTKPILKTVLFRSYIGTVLTLTGS